MGTGWLRGTRFDLAVGYVLTGIFGVAIILLAGQVLFPRGIRIAGSTGILDMAGVLCTGDVCARGQYHRRERSASAQTGPGTPFGWSGIHSLGRRR